MFFRKNKDKTKCANCNSGISKKFNFCPYCGQSFIDPEKEARDFGLLGRENIENGKNLDDSGFGIADKFLMSMINTLAKNLDKQFSQMEKEPATNIQSTPNGLKITFGIPAQKQQKRVEEHQKRKSITKEQIKKLSSLPKKPAKSTMKRISNKVLYELATPGVLSPDDVIVSKLERGYEIKAIGEKSIYVNSIPVELPLKHIKLGQETIFVEFAEE